MANMLKPIREGERQAAKAYSKGLKTGFGPTESETSKLMEKQAAAQRAMASNVAKQMGSRPGMMTAKGVQSPVNMQQVAQQQGMFKQLADQEAANVRKTDELRQSIAAQQKERLRSAVEAGAKRRAAARQSVFDNAMAIGELGVAAGSMVAGDQGMASLLKKKK